MQGPEYSESGAPLNKAGGGESHMRCVCCHASVVVPTAGGVGPWLDHKPECPRSEWPLVEACTDEEGHADWRMWIATTAATELTAEGAVLVALTPQEGPRVVSRLYRTSDYADGRQLMDVAAGRQTRLLNEGEYNIYIVQRHRAGLTVYTGRHSILLDCPEGE